ncbi:SAM-dependent methyltransferase [Actinoallomurus sp. NBC_01490]|uniref:SAM-dependent methyltransferase n=1 Tax=Actinoallomurus sp. NBC_01490 TaxID=2903557 RepID=UPI002E30BD1D|nr:SAM-dependent methyltransferase [Actinoallomurus sp. NBC_01490]
MTLPRSAAVDMTRANAARLYDYVLGGKDHFAVDRAAAERIKAVYPFAPLTALEGRAFVGRAVRYLSRVAGIRQFIDLGSGLPAAENVHEVAHRIDPDARVVYVDNDPVAVSHGQALLAVGGKVEMIEGDLCEPEEVIHHPELRKLIDFDEPVAILITNVLQWITDDEDPYGAVARYKRAMPQGSYLVLSHCAIPDPEEDLAYRRPVEAICREVICTLTSRPYDEILRFFDGLELLEPGLVPVTDWRPEVPHLVAVPTWDETNDRLGEPSREVAAVIKDRKNRKWLLDGGIGRKM